MRETDIKQREKHVLQWHITHMCNLRCKHCYQDEYTKDLELEKLKDILNQYIEYINKNNYRGHINFTGGEPFMTDKIFSLMKICDKNNITYGILTNGTLINMSLIEELKTYKGLKFIQMSLEGTRKVNDDIRGKGTYKRIMNSIELLNKAGIETMISFTINENSYKELRKLIWSCRKHGVKRFWTDRLVPIGGIEEYEANGLKLITTEHYKEAIKILGQEHRLERYSKIFKPLSMRVHTNRALQFMSGCGEFYRCSAGDKLLTVLADGTLLPCRRLPIEIGNLTEHTIEELVENNEIINQLKDNNLDDECKNCHLSCGCKGGAKCITYAVTGSIVGKDINCWK